MNVIQYRSNVPAPRVFDFPTVVSVASCDTDFLPELHRSSLTLGMTRLFGETTRDKHHNTADAKQKRN